MSTNHPGHGLPQPYASILAAYITSKPLEKIAAEHGIDIVSLLNLLRAEPLVSALADYEEEVRRRNYFVHAKTALEVLASIAATSPDPQERRRAASEILRFLTPVCKATKEKASVLILTRPLSSLIG